MRAKTLERKVPLTIDSANTTRLARQSKANILMRHDERLSVCLGFCAIANVGATLRYGLEHVAEWREEFEDYLDISNRFHVEKPRSELGFPGFVKDSLLDGSNDINLGLVKTRMLAVYLTTGGLPLWTERLGLNVPQYSNALITTDIGGARNARDANIRHLLSGSSAVVTPKNATDGSIDSALEACVTIRGSHDFIGMHMDGSPAQFTTYGNELAYPMLRGSRDTDHYTEEALDETELKLRAKGLPINIGIDASHDHTVVPGTKDKDPKLQIVVAEALATQIAAGRRSIRVVMFETHFKSGKQQFDHGVTDPSTLDPELSITDPCINLAETYDALVMLRDAIKEGRNL